MNKSRKSREFLIEIASIIFNIFAIVASVLVFLNPKKYNVLFAIVFIISAVTCYIRGTKYIREKKSLGKIFIGISLLICSAFLIVMTILSLLGL